MITATTIDDSLIMHNNLDWVALDFVNSMINCYSFNRSIMPG